MTPAETALNAEEPSTQPVEVLEPPKPGPPPRKASMFASLRHRNYRLFFFGQLISLCGTFMQGVAMPWLVYQEMQGTAFQLGLVSAANMLPALIFSFVGGAAADRYPKRRLLLITQTVMMTCAFLFWVLIVIHHINLYWVVALAFASGVGFAFDVPARQSFVIEMVGKEDLMNAIALNSSTFNAARVIGPAIGGIVIADIGVHLCFLVNGLSFLAVLGALLLMRVPPHVPQGVSGSLLRNTLEGLHYARRHPVIRTTLLIIVISTIFGAPYFVLLPVFAKDVLHVGGSGYGFMMAAGGLGAVAAALGLAKMGNFPRKGALLLSAVVAFSLAIESFCWSHSFRLSLACLVVAGAAMTLYGSTCNTLLQTTVPDYLRGRIMALFSLAFIGMAPFGSIQAGFVAQHLGVHLAVGLGSAIVGVAGLLILLRVPELRKA